MFSSLFERYTKASTKSTACAQYTKEIDDLKSQLGISNQERNKLETELQTANQSIKDWETKYNAANQEHGNLASDLKKASEERRNWETKYNAANQNINEWKNKYNAANQNIKNWETKYNQMDQRIRFNGTQLVAENNECSESLPFGFKLDTEKIQSYAGGKWNANLCIGLRIAANTEVWIYTGANATGRCCHIHNGDNSNQYIRFSDIDNISPWKYNVRYIEVRSTPERIRDGKFFWQPDYDMGKLKDYIGRVVSFVSVGNQGYALDDTGNQKVGAGYHIWQFTTSNQNQQFLVDSWGRLVRVNTDLCISAKGGALRQSRDNDEWTHWILDSKFVLTPNADKNKAIDIEGGRWDNGIKLLSYAKHGKSNQQWKPITIEGFNFLGVEVGNNTLLTILFLLIVAILIYRIWICPRGGSSMGGGYGMHNYNRWR